MKKFLPHLKKYLRHLAFIIAMFFLVEVLKDLARDYVSGKTAESFVGFITITFFLWKDNYFTRNKT